MEYYLLVMNAKYFTFQEGPKRGVKNGNDVIRWSCGVNKSIKKNDKIFWVKVGAEPRGIFAIGRVDKEVFQEKHWNGKGKDANYVNVEVVKKVDYGSEYMITLDYLKREFLNIDWTPRTGGVRLDKNVGKKIEEMFGKVSKKDYDISVQEEELNGKYNEGSIVTIKVNRYERNSKAREACIKAHGYKCYACGDEMKDKYGKIGENFIHIHHQIPLSTIKKGYEVDPKKDLKPLCPNCHSMIHRTKKGLSIDELKKIIEEQSK